MKTKATKSKPVEHIKTEAAECAYWERSESTSHLDLAKMQRVSFPNLKPSTQVISLQLPADMLERIKVKANFCDVSYQSLIKIWLYEKLSG